MTTLELSGVLAAASVCAGFLGSLTGLGGGVVIIPLLTLVLGIDIRYAIGASLVSVIATSSGAAAAYVREGFSNIRIGMFLEIATTLGALGGAAIALRAAPSIIAVIFGGSPDTDNASLVVSNQASGLLKIEQNASTTSVDGHYVVNLWW